MPRTRTCGCATSGTAWWSSPRCSPGWARPGPRRGRRRRHGPAAEAPSPVVDPRAVQHRRSRRGPPCRRRGFSGAHRGRALGEGHRARIRGGPGAGEPARQRAGRARVVARRPRRDPLAAAEGDRDRPRRRVQGGPGRGPALQAVRRGGPGVPAAGQRRARDRHRPGRAAEDRAASPAPARAAAGPLRGRARRGRRRSARRARARLEPVRRRRDGGRGPGDHHLYFGHHGPAEGSVARAPRPPRPPPWRRVPARRLPAAGRSLLDARGLGVDRRAVRRAPARLARHEVRNVFMPPTALKLLRASGALASGVRLRTLASGGESLGEDLIEWGRATFGLTINEFYGQTECNLVVGNGSALPPVRPGWMGTAIPGHTVGIVDEAGRELPAGELGSIAYRRPDPVMFLRYWRNEAATAAKFRGDWLVSGDLGTRDEAGYFRFVGRDDDVITSGGYRIGPGEIETCLQRHPAVALAAVVGEPDPIRTEVVKAVVVLKPGNQPSPALAAELQEHVRSRLAAHEYPRIVEFAAELPLTATGKIVRRALRSPRR